MGNHLRSLQQKHDRLDQWIRSETTRRSARNDDVIMRFKKEKLHIKEEIDRLRRSMTIH